MKTSYTPLDQTVFGSVTISGLEADPDPAKSFQSLTFGPDQRDSWREKNCGVPCQPKNVFEKEKNLMSRNKYDIRIQKSDLIGKSEIILIKTNSTAKCLGFR
jgi:hypothetical protein